MSKQICFVVDGNGDPEDTEIIFAKSSVEAKRRWSNEHGDGDRHIAGISAKRRPEWDSFAPGPVPYLELLDAGWWVECHGCGVRISGEDIGSSEPYTDGYTYADWALTREYGPDLTLPVLDPYEPRPGAIWCRKACHDDDMTKRSRIKRMTAKAIDLVSAEVRRRWPGVEIDAARAHVYVNRDSSCDYLLIHDVRVFFKSPGMKYGATYTVRDEKWRTSYVINGRPWEPRDGYTCQTRSNRAPLSTRTRNAELWVANCDKKIWDAFVAPSKHQITGETA